MTLPDLPYDVWHYIASCVPDDYLKDLYFLNSAFLHTSMAARYRTLVLWQWCNLRFIERCGHPDVCHLVREVSINYPRPPYLRKIVKAHMAALESVLAHLVNVQSVKIVWNIEREDIPTFDYRVFSVLWERLPPLVSVHLHVKPDNLVLLAPPSDSTRRAFSRVENLTLHWIGSPSVLEDDYVAQFDFLFGSSPSRLSSLSIEGDWDHFETVPLDLPHLTELTLHGAYFDPPVMSGILDAYFTSLKRLSMCGDSDSGNLIRRVLEVSEMFPLPYVATSTAMESLCIDCPATVTSSWSPQFTARFHSVTGTLKELVLWTKPMSEQELEHIISLFPGLGGSPLRSLKMRLVSMGQDTLRCLAHAFPALLYLKAQYMTFQLRESMTSGEIVRQSFPASDWDLLDCDALGLSPQNHVELVHKFRLLSE